jgi:hypothetical protein
VETGTEENLLQDFIPVPLLVFGDVWLWKVATNYFVV